MLWLPHVFGHHRRTASTILIAGLGVLAACDGDSATTPPPTPPISFTLAAGPDSAYVNSGVPVSIRPGENDLATPSSGSRPVFGANVVAIVTHPRHGTASLVDSSRIDYVSSPGWIGPDTIRYVARVKSAVDTGVIRLNVLPGPFSVTPLEAPGGSVATVVGLTERGEVLATLRKPDSTVHAARWSNGQWTVLDGLASATRSAAIAINKFGDAVVTVAERPAIWKAGASTVTFPFPDDTMSRRVVDISDRGVLALDVPLTTWSSNDGYTPLVGASSWCVTPRHINNAGEVLGETCAELYPKWIVYHARAGYAGCFGGRWTAAADINDAGVIVGTAENMGTRPNVCIWRPGVQVADVKQTLGEWLMGLSRINNFEWMLGRASLGEATSPVLVVNGMVVPFVNLVSDQWTIVSTIDLNDRGQILADAVQRDGTRVPVLLTPTTQTAP